MALQFHSYTCIETIGSHFDINFDICACTARLENSHKYNAMSLAKTTLFDITTDFHDIGLLRYK